MFVCSRAREPVSVSESLPVCGRRKCVLAGGLESGLAGGLENKFSQSATIEESPWLKRLG